MRSFPGTGPLPNYSTLKIFSAFFTAFLWSTFDSNRLSRLDDELCVDNDLDNDATCIRHVPWCTAEMHCPHTVPIWNVPARRSTGHIGQVAYGDAYFPWSLRGRFKLLLLHCQIPIYVLKEGFTHPRLASGLPKIAPSHAHTRLPSPKRPEKDRLETRIKGHRNKSKTDYDTWPNK